MQTSQRVVVIHSPYSGRSSKLSEAISYLEQAGLEIVNTISIADLDDLPVQGPIWKANGIDIAISGGGDGLVGGVITHIAESSLPLGILPLGTSNDIARSLHIPQDLQEAAQVIAQGDEHLVDVGVAKPAQQAPHLASKHQSGPLLSQVAPYKHAFFAHALIIGVNVQFARIATNVATRQRFGRMTYPYAALETLVSHDALDIELEFDRLAIPRSTVSTQEQASPVIESIESLTSLKCRALQVAIINAPIFGGEREFALPGTSFDDRLLDIVVIEEMDIGKFGRIVAHFFGAKENAGTTLANGNNRFTHHPADLSGIPGIHHVQARGVMIMTSADPRDATLDGEVRGQTPLYVHVADDQLRVKVPKAK
ncbi:MAG TPA: diacylglycerol kinase family protein [Ktedonobacteraceae bacterium]|nr:diacylglycerol kinase family protein [Ktedonobacteraceae bacterium]